MPSLKERVQMYEELLHDIQMYREVVLDDKKVKRLLDNIGNWSYAHRRGNGELTEEEQQVLIDDAFQQLRDVK